MGTFHDRAKRIGLIALYTCFYGGIAVFLIFLFTRPAQQLSKESAKAYLEERAFDNVIVGDAVGEDARYYSGYFLWEQRYVSGMVRCRGGICEALVFKEDKRGTLNDYNAARYKLRGNSMDSPNP